ncbi:MAG: Hsp33 family molecular chaperone HslO [Longimicrobiales bacterium]
MNDIGSNYMIRAAAHGGLVRALAVNATSVVEALRQRHDTLPSATAALGRLATGALLFGAVLKDEDQLVTIRIQGDGPGGTLLASANGRGEVRGLIQNPQPDIEENREGKLNVRGVVGTSGHVTVTKDLGMKQPYAGTVEIVSGEVGEDLAYYLATSEQIPSAVGIGVFVETDGTVAAAGGYMVQIFAGVPEAAVAEIERVISTLPHPTAMIRNGDTPEQILTRIFGEDFEILERTPVSFACPCSRERAEKALGLLGVDEIEAMIADSDGKPTELKCEFCTETYIFSNDDLASLATMPSQEDFGDDV